MRDFIRDGKLVYAWPYEARAVWDRRRHRRVSGLLERITSSGTRSS